MSRPFEEPTASMRLQRAARLGQDLHVVHSEEHHGDDEDGEELANEASWGAAGDAPMMRQADARHLRRPRCDSRSLLL
jgi:hypothetical protein